MYGVLTEVASARIATPMRISPTELQGGTKGLINYQQQINFPNPWPGGLWRLRDIMDYELLVSDAALETMSKYRRELLRGVASMAEEAISSGAAGQWWTIPVEQHDPAAARHTTRSETAFSFARAGRRPWMTKDTKDPQRMWFQQIVGK